MNSRGLSPPLPHSTRRERTAHRRMGAAALAVSERISQSHLHNPAHKRKAERLPCRHRQAGAGAHGKAHGADETGAGYNGTAKGGKRLRMGAENE